MAFWCDYFLTTGSIPLDVLLEHHISRDLYYTAISTSHVVMMAVLSMIKVSFLLFVHHIEFLHDFMLDIFVSDNVWFFAPLLWMIMTYAILYLQGRSSLFRAWQPVIISNTPDRAQFGRTNKHKFAYNMTKRKNKKFNSCSLGRNKTRNFGYKTPKCVSDANLYLHNNNKSKYQTTWEALNTPGYEWLKPRLQEIRFKVPGQKYNLDRNLVASYFPA